MYGIDLETIPVKTFHTLFCPVYVFDVSQYSVRYEYVLWARPAKARR